MKISFWLFAICCAGLVLHFMVNDWAKTKIAFNCSHGKKSLKLWKVKVVCDFLLPAAGLLLGLSVIYSVICNI